MANIREMSVGMKQMRPMAVRVRIISTYCK